MRPVWNVVAGFTAGAVAVFCVDALVSRRQTAGEQPSDAQLHERIRARLPDLVSEPDAIEIEVESGIVRVSGRLASDERSALLMRLTDMPGVRMVRNSVSAFDDTGEPSTLRL